MLEGLVDRDLIKAIPVSIVALVASPAAAPSRHPQTAAAPTAKRYRVVVEFALFFPVHFRKLFAQLARHSSFSISGMQQLPSPEA